MSSINPSNNRSTRPAMAAARKRLAFIDLTQYDSDDDADMGEAPPSHQPAFANEGTDGQEFVSEDEHMDDTQSSSSSQSGISDVQFICGTPIREDQDGGEASPSHSCIEALRGLRTRVLSDPPVGCTLYPSKSPTPEESPLVHSCISSTDEAHILCTYDEESAPGESNTIWEAATTVGHSGENLDTSRDLDLKDIYDLRLRHLTNDVYKIVSKNKPTITIKACHDALTRGVGWQVPKAVDLLMDLKMNDKADLISAKASGQTQQAGESSSTSLSVAPPQNHQETSDNDLEVPWEVFQSFLTIQRADFSSGREFLQACERLRQKVLITWNLQFTQRFTHTLFINAMRSYDPFLAHVLRRVELAGDLEFKDLKRIIRMDGVADDTMIGRKTWDCWKYELSSIYEAYDREESDNW